VSFMSGTKVTLAMIIRGVRMGASMRHPPARRGLDTGLLFWIMLASYALSGPAKANLLINGDFEVPGATLTTNFVNVGSGTAITGWTTTQGSGIGAAVYYNANGSTSNIPNAESGSYDVQLFSGSLALTPSSIAQTVSLISGKTYTLSFWLNMPINGTPNSDVSLSISGSNFTTTTYVYNLSSTGQKNQPWLHFTATFTMTSNSATIRFSDVPFITDNGAVIDNIDLELATPEFAHWSIPMLFALGTVGLEMRRRLRVSGKRRPSRLPKIGQVV
jgi:hypothetical protein